MGVLIDEFSHKKLNDCLIIPGKKKEVIPRKILGKAAAARAMIQIPCPVTGWEYKMDPAAGVQQCRGFAGHAHPV